MEGGRFRSMIKRRFGRRTKKKSHNPKQVPQLMGVRGNKPGNVSWMKKRLEIYKNSVKRRLPTHNLPPLFHRKRPAARAHWKYRARSTKRFPENQPKQRIGLLKSLKRRINRDASPNPTVYKLTQPHSLKQNNTKSRRRSVRVQSNQPYAVLDIPRKSPNKTNYATLKPHNTKKNHTYQRLNIPSAYEQMKLRKSKQSTENVVPANIRQHRYTKVKPIPTKLRSKKRVKFVYVNNNKTPVQSVYASQQK
jgi:hypothetical protein